MNIKMLKAALAGLILSISGFANAGLITYDDRTVFENTLSSFNTQSFEGLASAGSLFNTTLPAGLTIGDVSYQSIGSSNYIAVVDPAFSLSLYDRGTGAVIHSPDGGYMRMMLPSDIFAIGADFSTIFRGFDVMSIEFSTGDTSTVTAGDPWTFKGFISDQEIQWVQFGGVSDYPLMDNFTYGTTVDVPEPSTLAIFALGMIGLASRRFKKQS